MSKSAAEPLHKLLSQIRHPVSLRENMAACLRHIYMGDPFTTEKEALPSPPVELFEEVTVKEVTVSGVRCAIYSPKQPSTGLLLYMHGGGFVIGSSEDTDYTTRQLCLSNGLTVISVNYRLAPETVFPGALDDCLQVFDWAIERSDELGFDASNIFLAGDSAGGNLAVSLASRLHQKATHLTGLILLAPWLDMRVEAYESYNRLAPTGIVFDAAFMGYARAAYLKFEDWGNPLASPILCDPGELPPTIILVGTDDPLVDQAVSMGERARDNGCKNIEIVEYEGMPHCFYSFPHLFDEERDCYQEIARFVRHQVGRAR
jgi:acetyl esterase